MSRIGDRGAMQAFVRSVELGGFSAAARELRLTPSALSKLVTRLENSLKVRLVNRSTRRVTPTPEGELYVARCRRILAEIEDAEVEVGRSRERPRGRLRVHAGTGFGLHLLAGEMPRFLERYPEIQVDLLIEDRFVDLVRENVDISVWPWAPEAGSLVARKIFDFERVICASPGYLRRHGTPRTPEELARHRCIGVSSVPNHTRWLFQMPSGPRAIEIALTASVNNAAFLYRFALAGVGIARHYEYIVADAFRDRRLVQVLKDYHCPEHMTMLAIYPQERNRLPRVAAMLDFLVEAFADRPWRAPPRGMKAKHLAKQGA